MTGPVVLQDMGIQVILLSAGAVFKWIIVVIVQWKWVAILHTRRQRGIHQQTNILIDHIYAQHARAQGHSLLPSVANVKIISSGIDTANV